MQNLQNMPDISIELPEPVRHYFEASNVHDIDRMIAPFADDARVKDEGADIVGREAIRGWMEETTRKYGAIAKPEHVKSEADADAPDVKISKVTALVSGNFPGSPIRLTYHFTIDRNRIVHLEIH
jgi:hypothetical protein